MNLAEAMAHPAALHRSRVCDEKDCDVPLVAPEGQRMTPADLAHSTLAAELARLFPLSRDDILASQVLPGCRLTPGALLYACTLATDGRGEPLVVDVARLLAHRWLGCD